MHGNIEIFQIILDWTGAEIFKTTGKGKNIEGSCGGHWQTAHQIHFHFFSLRTQLVTETILLSPSQLNAGETDVHYFQNQSFKNSSLVILHAHCPSHDADQHGGPQSHLLNMAELQDEGCLDPGISAWREFHAIVKTHLDFTST